MAFCRNHLVSSSLSMWSYSVGEKGVTASALLIWRTSDRVWQEEEIVLLILKFCLSQRVLEFAVYIHLPNPFQPFLAFFATSPSTSNSTLFRGLCGMFGIDPPFLHSQCRIQSPWICQVLYHLSICLLASQLLSMLSPSLYTYAFEEISLLSC